MRKLSRGVLVVFEGIDGSGKTTQILKVAQSLKKHKYHVTVTHEPTHNSKWGQLIHNKVLRKYRAEIPPETELEWYIKDRKWDLETNILPALEKKDLVLVDRYYLSNAAYQGALETFTLEYILEQNSFALKPDLWIIFDVTVQLGQARLCTRNKRQQDDPLEKADYQEKVRQNYYKLTNMDIGGKVKFVNASGGEEELTETLTTIILDFLKDFLKTEEAK